jgi:aromatic-L-amino-acid decarboxylase
MINVEEFRDAAHQMVDWMADYYENIDKYPVKSKVKPGEILDQIPDLAPEQGEEISKI